MALPGGAAAPTAAQVKAGQDAASTPVTFSGNFTNPTAGTAATATVGSLAASTTYDVYVVAEDAVPNLQTDANVKLVTVTTLTPDTTPPSFGTGSPAASGITTTGFTLSSTINEVGKTYYVVLASGASAPTATQVKAGQDAAGAAVTLSGNFTNPAANTAATASIAGLTSATTYDVYVVAEDGIPNLQASPVLLPVTTVTPTSINQPTLSSSVLCPGTTVDVTFTASGTYTGTNAFNIQLSGPTGTFPSTPVVIGTITTTSNTAQTVTSTIPAGTAAGTGYLVRVVSTSPVATSPASAAFVVSGVTVAPTTTQNILTNANGTTLTATENTTALSRQWAYGAAAAGPYSTDIVGQTAATYTPNFSSVGTYYVVVKSTVACGTVVSNAVRINVTAPVASLTVNNSVLEGFATNTGTVSAEQQYTLTAANLSAPITVTATGGYEVSLTTATGFASTISAPATGGTIFVRIAVATAAGAANGTISNVSGAQSADVTTSGFVYPAGTTSCMATEGFESATFPPTGWLFSSVARSTAAADIKNGIAAAIFGSNNGSLATPALAYPVAVSFYLGRTTNTTAKSFIVEVSPTGQNANDFVTVATFTHTEVPSGSYNQYSVDLSAYSSSAQVWVRFRKASTTTSAWRFDDVNFYCAAAPTGSEIDVTQSGSSIPSGGAYGFGAVQAGTTATATFTIQNTGTANLSLTNTPAVQFVSGGSADFTVTAQPATSTIAAAGSTTFTVTFTPSGTTAQAATLSIANDDATGSENPYLITLTGTVPPTYVWNGTGTSWAEAGSWTPTRSTVAPSDVLVFDGSTTATATITTDFTSPQTVAQLLFRNNVTATFNNTGTRILNISNGNSLGADLVIGAGSSLLVMNPNNSATVAGLTLQLGTSATAAISGALTFNAVVAATGAHRLQGSGATSIEFLSGSSFTAGLNFSGNAFGATSTYANNVVFRSGSRLEQTGGSQPFGLTAPATVLTMDAGSLYVYSVPGNTVPPLSSRSFGNLEINVGSTNNATSVANGALTIVGDLTVTSGNALLNLDNTISIGGNIAVNGASSTLTFVPDAGGVEIVRLNGTAIQTIGGTAPSTAITFGPTSNLEISNPAGVVLARPLTLQQLTLTSGTITTDATNLLTLGSSATLTGGSATSFVKGPLAHVTPAGIASPTAYVFPVGKGSYYRPFILTLASQASASTYTAEQVEGNPNPVGAGNLDPGNGLGTASLKRVSGFRAFTLTSSNTALGNATGSVTLSFDSGDRVNVPNDPGLVVAASVVGSVFNNLGNAGTTGGAGSGPSGADVAGTITSQNIPSAAAAVFVLGATNDNVTLGATINPLPVELTAFTAQRQADKSVAVKWTTASEKNSDRFEVQRSLNGRDFVTIATATGQGSTSQATAYTALDAVAPAAQLYYRLRQLDHDGSSSFSPVVSVAGTGATTKVLLYPNPAQGSIRFLVGAATPYRVLNQLGQALLSGTTEAGTATVAISQLPTGLYFLELQTATGRSVQKFEKE